MRVTTAVRVGFDAEHALAFVLMQGFVQAGQHANGVAEGGMDRDIFDSLSVDPNLAPIAYALDVFLRAEWPRASRRLPFRTLRRRCVLHHPTRHL